MHIDVQKKKFTCPEKFYQTVMFVWLIEGWVFLPVVHHKVAQLDLS